MPKYCIGHNAASLGLLFTADRTKRREEVRFLCCALQACSERVWPKPRGSCSAAAICSATTGESGEPPLAVPCPLCPAVCPDPRPVPLPSQGPLMKATEMRWVGLGKQVIDQFKTLPSLGFG
jgi:hypothetical protein